MVENTQVEEQPKAKIFISYSHQDSELVRLYIEKLQSFDFQILYDENILVAGEQISSFLENAQEESDGTIVFLTEASINSESVRKEMFRAIDYTNSASNKKFLIPLLFYSLEIPEELRDIYSIRISPEPPGEDVIIGIVKMILDFINRNKPAHGPTKKTTENNKNIKPGTGGQNESEYFNPSSLSEISTDTPSAEIVDQLDFESDIHAIASIMVYTKVKPPLAIGLFGNWGSGKSFFMNKLQQRIRLLSETKSEKYCQNVIHVNFNSWHYSDSNLWASLITKIFEEIQKHGKKESLNITGLFGNLNSTRELINETEKEKKKIDAEILVINSRLEQVNAEINRQARSIKGIGILDLTKEILLNEEVKKEFKAVQEEYKFLDLKDFKQLENNLGLLGKWYNRIRESIGLIWTFRTGNRIAFLLLAIVFLLGAYVLVENVALFTEWMGKFRLALVPVFLLISQTVVYLKPAMKTVNNAFKKLMSLKVTCDALEDQIRNKQNNERDELSRKIEAATKVQSGMRQQIEQLKSKRDQLQIEINDIASGKKIVRFIESRVTDQRYINSLGIISWIRKDFEELDFLLKQQYDANKLKELDRTFVKDIFQIDRIILYIDDLDRCDVSTVVRVLEAIHLLLAFPLFVVVVGVDPRWMHNALNLKYQKFLKSDITPGAEPPSDVEINGTPATSFDYLEKIFQIPFVLKPLKDSDKMKLVLSQFEKKDSSVPEKKGAVIPPGKATVPPDLKEGGGEAATPGPEPGARKAEVSENSKKPEPRLLDVTDAEIALMQSLVFLLGESPRAIKRNINIYRIIRTHSNFRFTDSNETDHYIATMILLGIMTGISELARDIFQHIKAEQDQTSFSSFLDSLLEQNETTHPYLVKFQKMIAQENQMQQIGEIPMGKFKANIELIARFSFRNLA